MTGNDLFLQMADGRISETDLIKVENFMGKMGIDFDPQQRISDVYDALYNRPGDYKEWEDSDKVMEIIFDSITDDIARGESALTQSDFEEYAEVYDILNNAMGWY